MVSRCAGAGKQAEGTPGELVFLQGDPAPSPFAADSGAHALGIEDALPGSQGAAVAIDLTSEGDLQPPGLGPAAEGEDGSDMEVVSAMSLVHSDLCNARFMVKVGPFHKCDVHGQAGGAVLGRLRIA